MSTIDVIRRASRPETAALLEAPDGGRFVPADISEAASPSGLVIYRFGSPLYFANASLLLKEIEQVVLSASTPVRWFVLDAEAITDVDSTGADVLRQAIALLASHDTTFAVSRASGAFRSWVEKYGLLEQIGQGHFYPANRRAAKAFRQVMRDGG